MVLTQTRFGAMLVNENDVFVGRSLIAYGEFSQGEANLFSDIVEPGWRVADVGANVGAHTLLFSRLVGPRGSVHAYEPQRAVYNQLCANLALNDAHNVWAHRAVVGAGGGSIALGDVDPHAECNFGGLSVDALRQEGAEAVPVIPLSGDFHFIKVDVEGMESEVLRGAKDSIARNRPLLYVENDRDDKSPELLLLLEELGYDAFWHVTPLFPEENFRGNAENIWGANANYVSLNLFCTPKERPMNHDLDKARECSSDYLRKRFS